MRKKKISTLDRYLIFSFAVLLLYTIASMAIFCITGQEMQTLTACLYAAFGGEVMACAMIKRLKLKKENEEAG